MDRFNTIRRDRIFRFIIFGSALATVLLLVAIAWMDFKWDREAIRGRNRDVRIKELQGIITLLDEVLTMSARMAATTGDSAWENRYREFEPRLSAAIDEAIRIAPRKAIDATNNTDNANTKLVEMENRAFALVRKGNLKDAQQILFGERYAQQKQVYSHGMAVLDSALGELLENAEQQAHQKSNVRTGFLVVVMAVLVIGWMFVMRWMLQTKSALRESHCQLRELNQSLENRVAKRTTELAKANSELEQEIIERQALHDELMELSREAGMAEVATGVLHNVGNVLNSVNVSSELLTKKLRNSAVTKLQKASTLIDEHADDLSEFLTNHEQGKRVPEYLSLISDKLATDHEVMEAELKSLCQNIAHVKEIVNVQQSYATISGVEQQVNLHDLLTDALHSIKATLPRSNIEVTTEVDKTLSVTVDKHKLMQILVNLLTNAVQALQDSATTKRKIAIRVYHGDSAELKIEVKDNGVGIGADDLGQIFKHGFTTKKNGNGFGLHYTANAANELGGGLDCHSDGPGLGACFTVTLPDRHMCVA